MEALAQNVQDLMQHSPWLAFVAVLLGGMLTACNPCVLAMIPLSIAYVAGTEGATNWKRSLGFSLCMVLGLSVTFAALGVLASLLGGAVGGGARTWNWVVAAVCIVMGLHFMEVLTVPMPRLAGVQPTTRGALGALLLGMLFGLASTPCAGPILVVLLAYLATKSASALYGGSLLFSYALGHSALILLAGTSMGLARGLLASHRFTRGVEVAKKAAGAVIIAIGIYFAYQAA